MSRGFPNLIEDFGSESRLVLRQEATAVLLHDIGRVLNGVSFAENVVMKCLVWASFQSIAIDTWGVALPSRQ